MMSVRLEPVVPGLESSTLPLSHCAPLGDGLGSGRPVRGYNMTTLLPVPCHITGMGALSYWNRKLFPKVHRLAGHVGEGLNPHSVGL